MRGRILSRNGFKTLSYVRSNIPPRLSATLDRIEIPACALRIRSAGRLLNAIILIKIEVKSRL